MKSYPSNISYPGMLSTICSSYFTSSSFYASANSFSTFSKCQDVETSDSVMYDPAVFYTKFSILVDTHIFMNVGSCYFVSVIPSISDPVCCIFCPLFDTSVILGMCPKYLCRSSADLPEIIYIVIFVLFASIAT